MEGAATAHRRGGMSFAQALTEVSQTLVGSVDAAAVERGSEPTGKDGPVALIPPARDVDLAAAAPNDE
jgi:hypothetical protein